MAVQSVLVGIEVGGEWHIYQVGGFYMESITTLREINCLYYEVHVGCEDGGLPIGGSPKMHDILGLSQVGHLHLSK